MIGLQQESTKVATSDTVAYDPYGIEDRGMFQVFLSEANLSLCKATGEMGENQFWG